MSTFPLSDNFVMYGDGECSSDYVVIPSASEDGAVLNSRDRYCGTALGRCMAPLGGGTGCNAMAGSVTSKKVNREDEHFLHQQTLSSQA